MNFSPASRRWHCFVFAITSIFASISSVYAQSSLNVTNFGALGDAVPLLAITTSNSPSILCQTNRFATADVGKIVELFNAGPATSPTNNQDLVGTIVSVQNSTRITLSCVCGVSLTNAVGIYGRNNSVAFQNCINSVTNLATINIPAGSYLMLSAQVLDTNFSMPHMFATYPAVTVRRGGITFLGASRTNTILLGCGGWQLKGPWAYRGYLISVQGPVTNLNPLVFDNLSMDGGVQIGRTSYTYFPADLKNGSGWDVTHDAVIDTGSAPFPQQQIFRNCTFRNWRGEILKSVVSGTDAFIQVTNCAFLGGNATAFNFSFSHTIEKCVISNMVEAVEFYQGYCSNTCYFRNNLVTDMCGGLYAINGGITNHSNPEYYITNNVFYTSGNGIQTCPAQNLKIVNNLFIGVGGGGTAINPGIAGYQGNGGINSNIFVAFNVFSNLFYGINIEGVGANRLDTMVVVSNTMYGGTAFATGYGWMTNVVVKANTMINPINGIADNGLCGQLYFDDPQYTNSFPQHGYADYVGVTNPITYGWGRRHKITVAQTNSVFMVDDSVPSKIPQGSVISIANMSSRPVPIFFSSSMVGFPTILKPGISVTCAWTNSYWKRVTTVPSPNNLRPLQ